MTNIIEKPDYVPSHYPPQWLSSADVRQAIADLAHKGADKAVCWDMMMAIARLEINQLGATALKGERA